MLDSPLVERIIQLAIEEDLGSGDITSELTVPASKRGRAEIIAKEALITCGLPLVARILAKVPGGDCSVHTRIADGSKVKAGDVLLTISGPLRKLLAAERTILNFLQRLSGVATGAAKVCGQGKGVTVLDSRKTTPGFRLLEKYAVQTGGGRSHRMNLGDMILVKNNHIDANGGSVRRTLAHIAAKKPAYMPVEVEVRNLKELKEALPFSPEVIMLDNMSDAEIKQSLAVIQRSDADCVVEVSGGVTAERLPKLKKLGIKVVSMGTLTTQARNVDISMRIR